MKKQSEFLKLKSADFWKGLTVAVFSATSTSLGSAIAVATNFADFNWQIVVLSGAGGFVGYISKNFITNSEGQMLKTETKEDQPNA